MTSPNFQVHVVDRLSEVPGFGTWLGELAQREEPVGVALRSRGKKIAFSSLNEAYVVDLKDQVGALALGILRMQLIDRAQLKFLGRDVASDLVELTTFLHSHLGVSEREMFNALSPVFVGNLTGAARCINQDVTPSSKFRKIEQDAFEIALIEPQYAHGIPSYYQKVELPVAKLIAEARLFKPTTPPDWWVSYEDLWIKVFAFYSGDPTLSYALQEGRDVLDVAAKLLHTDSDTGEKLLLWQACGRDMTVFMRRFPTLVDNMPADLDAWGPKLDKAFPSLVLTCSHMQQAYWETRSIETLFKRRLRPGQPMGEAVAFRVFGTVEELVAIAAATFWMNRPSMDIMVTGFQGGAADRTIRVSGHGPKSEAGKLAWTESLKYLAPLAEPLSGVPLRPTIVRV